MEVRAARLAAGSMLGAGVGFAVVGWAGNVGLLALLFLSPFLAARLGLGSVTARSVELTARLLDEGGRAVREQTIGRAGGPILSARLPVDRLAPGTYTLELSAQYRDRVVARATDALRVAASPFGDQ